MLHCCLIYSQYLKNASFLIWRGKTEAWKNSSFISSLIGCTSSVGKMRKKETISIWSWGALNFSQFFFLSFFFFKLIYCLIIFLSFSQFLRSFTITLNLKLTLIRILLVQFINFDSRKPFTISIHTSQISYFVYPFTI